MVFGDVAVFGAAEKKLSGMGRGSEVDGRCSGRCGGEVSGAPYLLL